MSNVSRLALGTAQFGLQYGIANTTGQVSLKSVEQILHSAQESGLDLLDTAPVYGESQSVLGRVGLSGWKVVTKLPGLRENILDVTSWTKKRMLRSLRELQLPEVYGLLCHKVSDLLGPHAPHLIVALENLKQTGYVQKVGVSVYSPEDLDKLLPVFKPEIVQIPFNILDRRFLSSGWVQEMASQGIEIHCRSIFLQGLLLQSAAQRKPYFNRWANLLSRWDNFVVSQPVAAHTLCVWFALSFPQISRIVVGLDSMLQLSELIDSALSAPDVSQWPDLETFDEDLLLPMRWRSE